MTTNPLPLRPALADESAHPPADLQVPEAPVRGVIWHFSDLHFRPAPARNVDKGDPVYGPQVTAPEPFSALFEWAKEQKDWRADFLVISGDFVHAGSIESEEERSAADPAAAAARGTARAEAFEQARSFVDSLASAVEGEHPPVIVVCPGNHDVDMAAAERGDEPERLRLFHEMLGKHRHPGKTPTIATRGVCLLSLDTTGLSGRLFDLSERLVGAKRKSRVSVQADAALYDFKEISRALESLGKDTATAVQRGALLGVVVAHHPPSLVPSVWVEVKPYAEPVAAPQAKADLARRGFRVFLHGHKHAAVAQEELMFPANQELQDGVLVLGAAAFNAKGDLDQGFSVIEYLVAPQSGEARLILHPFGLHAGTPTYLRRRRFSLPPQERAPAGTIRLTAVIDEQGDCRLDSEFLEIPLPPNRYGWRGWRPTPRGWTRTFPRHGLADLDVASPPCVWGTSRGVQAEVQVPPALVRRANRRYSIEVSADRTSAGENASFVERVFLQGAYAVSRMHQRRVGGTLSLVPGVGDGWEGLMHGMREPAGRLEILVEMPFALEGDYRVEVEAYVARDGEFVEEPSILDFTPAHRAVNFLARRVLVTIDKPVVGAAYVVRWQLPMEDPANREPSDIPHYQNHRLQAESCRSQLHECTRLVMSEEYRRELMRLIGPVLDQLKQSSRGRAPELRWSLYVPEHGLTDDGPATARNLLVRCLGSHPTPAGWRRWQVGSGVAGRAYALNRVIEEVGPTSARFQRRPARESWLRPEFGVYEPAREANQHAVLYGIPLHVDSRPELVWGVFCLGTWTPQTVLDLNEPFEPGAAKTGLQVLRDALEEFSKSLRP